MSIKIIGRHDENTNIEDEIIKELLAIKLSYGINDANFGIMLLACGTGLMKQSGTTKYGICDMIMQAN